MAKGEFVSWMKKLFWGLTLSGNKNEILILGNFRKMCSVHIYHIPENICKTDVYA